MQSRPSMRKLARVTRELWNTRYAEAGDDYVFGIHPNAFLASQKHLLRPGRRALSVADGEGRNSVWLAQQGVLVDAVEFAPAALAKARRLAARRGLGSHNPRFIEADLLAWDWPVAHYDWVVAIFIQFAGPGERPELFRHLIAALKPGGRLLLQGYTPKQLDYRTGGPSAVDNLYTEAMLRNDFAALQIERLEAFDEIIEEGAGHSGMSALIDLVATKPA
jgi:cyclopropane fatty-acyl-phospholipid synthase-like methyltransferase